MASASTLTRAEVQLIKAMLNIRPRLAYQKILAYFSFPGRDINHRVISQINSGVLFGTENAASEHEARAYMAAARAHRNLSPAATYIGSAKSPTTSTAAGFLQLDWWPVGQGLFASGTISGLRRQPFTWVFDCGTTSKTQYLDTALQAFEQQQRACRTGFITLAALSHFDRDHISGLVKLIGLLPIRTLLLPYILPWRRMLIALELGVAADDPDFGFFLDPVAYLANLGAGRIEEIIWVQPSGPDDLPGIAEDGPAAPIEGPEAFDGGLKVEYDDAPAGAENDPSASSRANVQVRFLKKGGLIVWPSLWEFVPYNDGELAPRVSTAFRVAAEALLDKLLHVPKARTDALADLKKLYDQEFKSSKERNQISLFLYSGPLSSRIALYGCPRCGPDAGLHPAFSQMHTGDGYLTIGPRYSAFESFYAPNGRLGRSAFFQVMHHGASANWHKGIAGKLNPQWSIFSSDPEHKKYHHPHAEVVRDFWSYRPIQVDRTARFNFHGELFVL